MQSNSQPRSNSQLSTLNSQLRRWLLPAACTIAVIITAWAIWSSTASVTRIALVEFQPFQRASIVKANEDRFIRYETVTVDELHKLRRYDFVLGFGMGMRITAGQRAQIQQAVSKGVPVHIHAATNPDNNISSLDSIQLKAVAGYLNNGNRRNYQSLGRYIRQTIDGKRFFVNSPDSVQKTASDVLYHLDENLSFETVAAYETHLRQHHFYIDNAPRIAIIGGLNDPFSGNRANIDSLITAFQHAGMNVYPVLSAMKRLHFLKEIQPDAVIYFAHGRLAMGQAEAAVEWLKERNIPVFAPLSILKSQDEWQDDPMGMSGGFMSQSVVMPELDGAIYPYVLDAQIIDRDGLYLFTAIPERLSNFTQIVRRFISLKQKRNADKRIAIYYFKGAGQSTLAAQGLETVPSLHNFLLRMKAEGYTVENLPADVKTFEAMLMTRGSVMSTYAEGSFDNFLTNGNPALVDKSEYESWTGQSLPPSLYADVVNTYGEAPGKYMSVDGSIAVARIQLGNIALLPQPPAALGDDAFAIIHGAKSPPPHPYIAAYLWSQHSFKADAILHFGTHGSLEFTPQKQVALSDHDWPDRLVGVTPHFYYYTIGNIGESVMAKRRSYATTISYLTPPFTETGTRSQFKVLQEKIRQYYKDESDHAAMEVQKVAVQMGLHRDLRLDSIPTTPYTKEDIERIESFAEEIANEKMTGQLYTSGIPYSAEKIHATVSAMSSDPIAYSLANLDNPTAAAPRATSTQFTQTYLEPAKTLVNQILNGKAVTDDLICALARISPTELAEARLITSPPSPRMMPPVSGKPKPQYTSEQKSRARAIVEIERTVRNITAYKEALDKSPEHEFRSLLNALAGGYITPSSGGDAVANPNAVPTGRNLYSINAEATPTETAWEKGVALVNSTLEKYRKQHGDYPRKASYTFWSSEFIESEGTTIAQVLFMLGVEPVRDAFGRVSDIQLIPSATLGRPRIDVVVQTSGQFRDLAASRLSLISRAVEMAASAKDDKYDNLVSASVVETERQLVEQGISPKEARELSVRRIFGGVNGMYGTNIQGMVTSGDRWETEKEIAETYLNNMGATYGDEKAWGEHHDGLLRAALHNTDIVVQPRQSNTWGALSLDHVYEFMGGLNLAVRNVTGKDPEAYFADYRNRNNARMQELKEAIGVEARATVFNPAYIKEVMKGNASSAAQITEVITNTYGWNVMKPKAIDNEMWDRFYDVYVKDEYKLGTEAFFRRENPQALQEITAVMLETARKGMWKATEEQLSDIAALHTELVKDFGSSASGFSGGNAKLQDFIARTVDNQSAGEYRKQLQKMQTAASSDAANKGMVLKRDEINAAENGEGDAFNGLWVAVAVVVVFVGLVVLGRKRRRKD